MERLTRKNVKFEWNEEEEEAFNKIKNALPSSQTLAHINNVDPIMLKTDASGVGVVGMLLQEQNQVLRLIACISRYLKPAEKNYPPIELEALAVIYSLNKFRHYLLGRRFTIVTDHSALYVVNRKTPQNARVERWALVLAEYDFKFIHQKGKCHEDVDCLSRAPVITPEDDNLDKILNINSPQVTVSSVRAIPIDIDDWLNLYDTENESNEFLEKAKGKLDEFSCKNGIIYFRDQLYVPEQKRQGNLYESHATAIAAHDGIEGTLNRVKAFWWPDMKKRCHCRP